MGITQHNISNRTIFCKDNLEVLQGMNSESVDLIYLDPPFNKKKVFTAPIGSSAEGAEFSDIFREEDVKEEWLETIEQDNESIFGFLSGIRFIEGRTSYNFCYLAYMAIRLIECHRILKSTGSLYLHCDPTMSHYIKILLDCVFGEKQFRNEVIWHYNSGPRGKCFGKRHDTIFLYSKTGKDHTFNKDSVREPYSKYINIPKSKQHYYHPDGKVMGDVWKLNILAQNDKKERTGYPTQKPLALLERIIKASSNENDIVLDPFCGCATTCIAAEMLGRQWIGIDVSQKAYELVQKRLMQQELVPSHDGKGDLVAFKTDAPQRTDQDKDYREKKWVYIISHPLHEDEYKVGIAKNWKSRLNSYQTSDPDRAFKMEYRIETADFKKLEKHIHNHERFDNRHEWVYGVLDEIIEEIEKYAGRKGIRGKQQKS